MKKVLMVCMGNICRSPMAQTVGQKLANEAGLAQQLKFDSAGTHAHHSGERPDPRAEAALLRSGYEMGRIRSKRLVVSDFQNFDLILAMDSDNLAEMKRICPPEQLHKIRLLLEFASGLSETEVPDPYYGNEQGFERVLGLCEVGCKGLVNHFSRV
jgi:protein-tyrosine phosphatase